MVVISICMILILGSVLTITAAINGNYEEESIEKSAKVIDDNGEENIDSIYSEGNTKAIINNVESEKFGETGAENRNSIEENTETAYTPQN